MYPIECLSSCQRFFCVDPQTCSELGPHRAFFVFPPSDFIHQCHSTGKDCFGLNISFSVSGVRSKGSVVHEDFTKILSVCTLSTALLLGCVHFLSKAFSRASESCVSCVSTHAQFWDIVIRQAFRLQLAGEVPKTSFLSPIPWRLRESADGPLALSRVDDGPDSTRHSTKGKMKVQREFRGQEMQHLCRENTIPRYEKKARA